MATRSTCSPPCPLRHRQAEAAPRDRAARVWCRPAIAHRWRSAPDRRSRTAPRPWRAGHPAGRGPRLRRSGGCAPAASGRSRTRGGRGAVAGVMTSRSPVRLLRPNRHGGRGERRRRARGQPRGATGMVGHDRFQPADHAGRRGNLLLETTHLGRRPQRVEPDPHVAHGVGGDPEHRGPETRGEAQPGVPSARRLPAQEAARVGPGDNEVSAEPQQVHAPVGEHAAGGPVRLCCPGNRSGDRRLPLPIHRGQPVTEASLSRRVSRPDPALLVPRLDGEQERAVV